MILFTYLYFEMTNLTFFAPVVNCLRPPNPKSNSKFYSNSIVNELKLGMDVPFKLECNIKNKFTNSKCKLHLKSMCKLDILR
jgi:hypothetical protein